jgi:hypothetical protein
VESLEVQVGVWNTYLRLVYLPVVGNFLLLMLSIINHDIFCPGHDDDIFLEN